MFEEFSTAYYIGHLYVEPVDGEHAVMEREQHEEANEQVYTTGEGIERMDNPLVVKLDGSYFPVFSAEDVPTDTLAVPDEVLEATRVDDPPTLEQVLVAKAERAGQLLEWFTSYRVGTSDIV